MPARGTGGMARVEAILEAATRVVSVSFGVGDYSLSMGGQDRLTGGANPAYAILTDKDGSGEREGTGTINGTSRWREW